jgi:hypothetical protein
MRDKVKEFLKLTQFYEMASETIASLIENTYEVDDPLKAELEEVLQVAELENYIVPMYEQMFTEGELDAILHFFKSPVGVKMMQVNDQLSENVNAVFTEWLAAKYDAFIEDKQNS